MKITIIFILFTVLEVTFQADRAHVYTTGEYVDMIECYILAHHNSAQAKRDYHEKYRRRIQPNDRTFVRAYDRFVESGSVVERREGLERPIEDYFDIEDEILRLVTEERGIGQREIARRVGCSLSKVQRLLKLSGMCYRFIHEIAFINFDPFLCKCSTQNSI